MTASKAKRPRSVTILAAGVLTIAGLALLRLVAAIQQWSFLAGLPGYSPFYIACSGLIWSVLGTIVFWGLWRGTAWAPRMAKIVLTLFAAFYWFDRLIMSNRQAGKLFHIPANAGFLLLITVLSLGFCYWALSRKTTNLYFGDRHERTT